MGKADSRASLPVISHPRTRIYHPSPAVTQKSNFSEEGQNTSFPRTPAGAKPGARILARTVYYSASRADSLGYRDFFDRNTALAPCPLCLGPFSPMYPGFLPEGVCEKERKRHGGVRSAHFSGAIRFSKSRLKAELRTTHTPSAEQRTPGKGSSIQTSLEPARASAICVDAMARLQGKSALREEKRRNAGDAGVPVGY